MCPTICWWGFPHGPAGTAGKTPVKTTTLSVERRGQSSGSRKLSGGARGGQAQQWDFPDGERGWVFWKKLGIEPERACHCLQAWTVCHPYLFGCLRPEWVMAVLHMSETPSPTRSLRYPVGKWIFRCHSSVKLHHRNGSLLATEHPKQRIYPS